jgi:hypothetical protein
MASSEVSEVRELSTNCYEDDVSHCEDMTALAEIEIDSNESSSGLDLCVGAVQEVSDSLSVDPGASIYGEEMIVNSEDVPQSEEIIGADALGSVYDTIPVPSSVSPPR